MPSSCERPSGAKLRGVPARAVVRAIASAAERWNDADFPPRVRATDRIVERTGYSTPVVEYALDRLFFSLQEGALCGVIAGELGSLEILDGPSARTGRTRAWATPVGKVCVVSSRTTIGVALVPAIFALCAKCDVLVKDREDSLIGAFFETLCEELDEFREAAKASAWNSGDEAAPDLRNFDTVVAYGSDGTLATIAASLPYSTRFIGYGTRASAGYVTRESPTRASLPDIVRGAARDLVLYESEGCLSLHVLFAERGGEIDAAAFAQALAEAVELANVEFPIGRRDAATTARVAQYRDLAAFRAAAGNGAVFSQPDAAYVIVLDPPRTEPPAFLPRALAVIPVDEPAEALEYLRAHRLPIEGFAISSERDDAIRMAFDAGAARIAHFGELQHPPLAGNHGGRPRIAEFVTWRSIEL